MGRLVYTVTAAGNTAAVTNSEPSAAGIKGISNGLAATNLIVSDQHPQIQQWLAAAYVAQITL